MADKQNAEKARQRRSRIVQTLNVPPGDWLWPCRCLSLLRWNGDSHHKAEGWQSPSLAAALPAERRVSDFGELSRASRRGWAGEKAAFLSILQEVSPLCFEPIALQRNHVLKSFSLKLTGEMALYPRVGKSAFSCMARPISPLIFNRPDIAAAVPLNWPFRTLRQSSPAIDNTTCGSTCIPSVT